MNKNPYDVKNRHKKTILKLPNVVGIGVGPKVINGKQTDIMSIKIYVSSKLPEGELSSSDIIPKQIEGIPTDVEEQAEMDALTRNN